MAVEINDANFEEIVLQSDVPVLVDFWAEWCNPCKMIAPIINELNDEYDGKAILAKMDVDNNSIIPNKYGIRNIPTMLFFKNGEIVDKQVGAVPKSIISQKIEAII